MRVAYYCTQVICLSVDHENRAETVEPIKIPFGLWTCGAQESMYYVDIHGNIHIHRHLLHVLESCMCLHCFDAVGWVGGRASGL